MLVIRTRSKGIIKKKGKGKNSEYNRTKPGHAELCDKRVLGLSSFVYPRSHVFTKVPRQTCVRKCNDKANKYITLTADVHYFSILIKRIKVLYMMSRMRLCNTLKIMRSKQM